MPEQPSEELQSHIRRLRLELADRQYAEALAREQERRRHDPHATTPPTTRALEAAHWAGYRAHFDHKQERHCPYKRGTAFRRQWLAGFRRAQTYEVNVYRVKRGRWCVAWRTPIMKACSFLYFPRERDARARYRHFIEEYPHALTHPEAWLYGTLEGGRIQ